MKLLILAFANDKNILLTNLKYSLKKYGYEYKIIGDGIKWVNFMTKIKECYDYINNLEDDYIISIIDAYDILACDSPDVLLSKFLSYNSKIVIGAENDCGGNCVPLVNYFKNNNKKSRYKYANGGFYIGYKQDILFMLEYILDLNISDDQIGLGKYINDYPENIYLDTDGDFISNVNIRSSYFDTYWINGRVKNIKTKKFPCFVHTPSIQYDFHNRMDYFGYRILGNKYKTYTYKQKITRFYNKYQSKINYFLIISILIILIIIYLLNING